MGPRDTAVNKAMISDCISFCSTWGITMLNRIKKVKYKQYQVCKSAEKKNKAELEDGMPLGFGERKEH